MSQPTQTKPEEVLFVFVGNRTAREDITKASTPAPDWAVLLLLMHVSHLLDARKIPTGPNAFNWQDGFNNCSVAFTVPDAQQAAQFVQPGLMFLAMKALIRISVRVQGRWLEIHSPADGNVPDNRHGDMAELALAFHKFSEQHRALAEAHFRG